MDLNQYHLEPEYANPEPVYQNMIGSLPVASIQVDSRRSGKSVYKDVCCVCADSMLYPATFVILILLLLGCITNIALSSVKVYHMNQKLNYLLPTPNPTVAPSWPIIELDSCDAAKRLDYIISLLTIRIPEILNKQIVPEIHSLERLVNHAIEILSSDIMNMELNLGGNNTFRLVKGKKPLRYKRLVSYRRTVKTNINLFGNQTRCMNCTGYG